MELLEKFMDKFSRNSLERVWRMEQSTVLRRFLSFVGYRVWWEETKRPTTPV